MNIAPVFLFRINANKQQKPLSFRKTNPKEDVFVRQNKREIGLRSHYALPLKKLTEEMTEYILYAPEITYQGLYEILEKYSFCLDLRSLDPSEMSNKVASARYSQEFSYQLTKKGIKESEEGQIMYINIPKSKDRESREHLLENVIHESVHMFQEEARIEVLGKSYLKKYYDKAKTNRDVERITDALNKLSYGFEKFEQNINILMNNFLRESSLDNQTLEDFNGYLIMQHGLNFKDTVKLLIDDAYYNTGKKIAKTLGKEAVYNFAGFKIANEIEAYEEEDKIAQKYSNNIYRKNGSRLTVDTYKRMRSVIKQLHKDI